MAFIYTLLMKNFDFCFTFLEIHSEENLKSNLIKGKMEFI